MVVAWKALHIIGRSESPSCTSIATFFSIDRSRIGCSRRRVFGQNLEWFEIGKSCYEPSLFEAALLGWGRLVARRVALVSQVRPGARGSQLRISWAGAPCPFSTTTRSKAISRG